MSILDPDQNKVTDQLSEDMIRYRIREYCTRTRSSRYLTGWEAADPYLNITNVDKDERGWYIDTECVGTRVGVMIDSREKTLLKYADRWCENNPHKGFLIRDHNGPDTYFRWRKHEGRITVLDIPDFSSTEGLPEELEHLHLRSCCRKNGYFIVHNKIKLMELSAIKNTKISGSGCKNIVIDPAGPCNGIVIPNGVKIHRPLEWQEYRDLIEYIKTH